MKLSDYLHRRKIKPIEFAREIGVTPSVITRLVNGARGASLDLALKIEEHTSGEVRPVDLVRNDQAGATA